jgi:hypothetical protein
MSDHVFGSWWGLALVGVTLSCAGKPMHDARGEPEVSDGRFVQVLEPRPALDGDGLFRISSEPPLVDETLFACDSAADCVVLEMGCCDHCNGGNLMSVSSAMADVAIERYHQRDCAETCTDHACEGSHVALCADGQCARVEEVPLPGAASSVSVVRNHFAAAK